MICLDDVKSRTKAWFGSTGSAVVCDKLYRTKASGSLEC